MVCPLPEPPHLPANLKTVELVRRTTAPDLLSVVTAANLRLGKSLIPQVVDALKKAEHDSATVMPDSDGTVAKPCPYEILGLESRDAPDAEIKTAYRKAALRWHPDKNPEDQANAEAMFKSVSEAYQVLSDPDKHSDYDAMGQGFQQRGAQFHDAFEMYSQFFARHGLFAKLNATLRDAAGAGDVEKLQRCLRDGADPNAADEDGETALCNAAELNQVGCMETLAEAGADLDRTDNYAWTPLMVAAHFGQTAAVEWLLGRGADWRATDCDRKTALDWAEGQGKAEAAAVLEAWIAEHGSAEEAAEMHRKEEKFNNGELNAALIKAAGDRL